MWFAPLLPAGALLSGPPALVYLPVGVQLGAAQRSVAVAAGPRSAAVISTQRNGTVVTPARAVSAARAT
jgi:hypothetical protein